eukprot:CCRYP_003852-RA/>CCRYP_003852-RA protein AED:0.27 eAED:0.27 QI:3/1/1/1/0/0/2/73/40
MGNLLIYLRQHYGLVKTEGLQFDMNTRRDLYGDDKFVLLR